MLNTNENNIIYQSIIKYKRESTISILTNFFHGPLMNEAQREEVIIIYCPFASIVCLLIAIVQFYYSFITQD